MSPVRPAKPEHLKLARPRICMPPSPRQAVTVVPAKAGTQPAPPSWAWLA